MSIGHGGWGVDVIVPPNDTYLSIDLLPVTMSLDLTVSAQEGISLTLGSDGPPGPAGPPGPTVAEEVVLQAPDGSHWRVVVDNSGALSTEAI